MNFLTEIDCSVNPLLRRANGLKRNHLGRTTSDLTVTRCFKQHQARYYGTTSKVMFAPSVRTQVPGGVMGFRKPDTMDRRGQRSMGRMYRRR